MKKPVGAQRGFGAIAVIIALVFATVLVIGGALLYRYNRQESSYKNIISEFVTAMGNGDASKVASLESTRFQEWIHNDTEDQNHTAGAHQLPVTDSYYTLLNQEGMSITFDQKSLAGDKIETRGYKDGLYIAPRGTIGKSETYTAKTGQNYLPILTISVVKEGNTWAVDNITSYAYN